MLTRSQFEAYLISIKAPIARPHTNSNATCSRCKYYHRGGRWSDFATTTANCIAKDLPIRELNDFINSCRFNRDDPYDYYKVAIRAGLPIRLMPSIIHTKAHLC